MAIMLCNNHKTPMVFNNSNVLLMNKELAGDACVLGEWLADPGSLWLG